MGLVEIGRNGHCDTPGQKTPATSLAGFTLLLEYSHAIHLTLKPKLFYNCS